MTFADITIVPVSRERREAYVAFSRRMAEVYRDHGAARIVDYWQEAKSVSQEDFHAEGTEYSAGELRELAIAVDASASESVVVSITEWPSREVRDRGTKAATSDPRVTATLAEDSVFDGHRMLASGFSVALALHAD